MDPVTHALVGASLGHLFFSPRLGARAWKIGSLAGILPDADMIFRLATDPFTGLFWHRHFTHSFAFLPIAAGVGLLPWLHTRKQGEGLTLAACAGFAALSHLVLDGLNSYGTHLTWPLSQARTAWDILPVVDLFFLLLFTLGLSISMRRRSRKPVLATTLLGTLYTLFFAYQHHVALATAGNQPINKRIRAIPQPGPGTYEWHLLRDQGETIKCGRFDFSLLGNHVWEPGQEAPLFRPESYPGWENLPAAEREKILRFQFFCDGWILPWPPEGEGALADGRFSRVPGQLMPLWGIVPEWGTFKYRHFWKNRRYLLGQAENGRK